MYKTIFPDALNILDPDIHKLISLEDERQKNKVILIPSESLAPPAVLEALGSVFQNIYAEGYPDEDTRGMSEAEILDIGNMLGYYHRYSDPRYYKGVEYADMVEALARRRVAEVFSTTDYPPEKIFVNVQPLSGAPANNAAYHALINPGDTILGMSLIHGGHLTHGSPVNRSGKIYHAVHYSIDPETQKISYQQVDELADQYKPKIIIAGYSSYPWKIDWREFSDIAKRYHAYLLADISHVAGLVAAGNYPSPVGFADVITFTTHKTLCGPRGACILATDYRLARKIDRAVFPGEQGGPHVNIIAAIAVAMKLAKTDQFKELQRRIVNNCKVFTDSLASNGFKIPFGGTDTHLMNLDCSSIMGEDGAALSGDQAARILDLAGIVVNRNTIPGDSSAADPAGIRMGTPWVTQLGFDEKDMIQLANIISNVLTDCRPYFINGVTGITRKSKISFDVLESAKISVRNMLEEKNIPNQQDESRQYSLTNDQSLREWIVLNLEGEKVFTFLNYALESHIDDLQIGENIAIRLHTPGKIHEGFLSKIGSEEFELSFHLQEAGLLINWLHELSNGFIVFNDDLKRKLPGPINIRRVKTGLRRNVSRYDEQKENEKPYFIGIENLNEKEKSSKPDFSFEPGEPSLKRTALYDTHVKMGAKIIPFAGWEMPVWYSSVLEEHNAVRNHVGIFDVSHMGVYQVEGDHASIFLDSVCGNDIGSLQINESCYTHFLDPDANVIDDLLVYRRRTNVFLVVVNASNDDKDWLWLNSIKNRSIRISNKRAYSSVFGSNVKLRNLRDPMEHDDMRVDIALQGPNALRNLLSLGFSNEEEQILKRIKRTQLCEVGYHNASIIVSRTGYTGELIGFELFVHPDLAPLLFEELLEKGEPFGSKPIGLGARDSLRTEAGLPLYGHEMGLGSGKMGYKDLGVGEAGFQGYVKTYKPWFIGRDAFLQRENSREGEVIRFRFVDKGVRMAHSGDPVIDHKGKVIGFVTSCAIDREGFLIGQAFLNRHYIDEGTKLLIYPGASSIAGIVPSNLVMNDRTTIPVQATVIRRFPAR